MHNGWIGAIFARNLHDKRLAAGDLAGRQLRLDDLEIYWQG
jgi:hypothetical protein